MNKELNQGPDCSGADDKLTAGGSYYAEKQAEGSANLGKPACKAETVLRELEECESVYVSSGGESPDIYTMGDQELLAFVLKNRRSNHFGRSKWNKVIKNYKYGEISEGRLTNFY